MTIYDHFMYAVCVFQVNIGVIFPKRAGGVARALGRLLRLRGALPRSPEAPGGRVHDSECRFVIDTYIE